MGVVDADGRFERLIDRMKLMDAVARSCSAINRLPATAP
jgi:hypothetical protein